MTPNYLGWIGIFRLGLVQTALGAVVIMTTSTLNRVMVVELVVPALLPGLLVTLHHALQILRPRWGHGSDTGGRRTPWIVAGLATLALGGAGAAASTALMASHLVAGIVCATIAFTLVGIGVGATGTSLLAILATSVAPERRAAAATIVWLMMIAGFIVTTIVTGSLLDPFSTTRLVIVTSGVSLLAFVVGAAAISGVERKLQSTAGLAQPPTEPVEKPDFKTSLAQVWGERQARRFTVFIFVSMIAYSMQDLILEPFAGLVFGLTPGESTKLSGLQNSGVFAGMLLVAVVANPRFGFGSLKAWTIAGCIASALALVAIVWSANTGSVASLKASVIALGFANGAYAVAAIGSMMALASSGAERREGMRMGIWGASQALAFGLGGFLGTLSADALRRILDDPAMAYGSVFSCEALLFIVSAWLAAHAISRPTDASDGVFEPSLARVQTSAG